MPTTQPSGGPWSQMWWLLGLVVAFVGFNGFKDLVCWLWGQYSRPRLQVAVTDPVYTVATTTNGHDCHFFHLEVKNSGRRAARDCQVRLMYVKAQTQSEETRINGSGPTPLHWAHKPPDCERMDVPPHESAELDLFFQRLTDDRLIYPYRVTHGPDGIRSHYGDGKYTWHLRLSAEDTKSQDVIVSVDNGGKSWGNPPSILIVLPRRT